MKKRILSLIMMGMLIVPMVGCNANVKILGKEVFTMEENKQEEQVQEENGYSQHEEGNKYSQQQKDFDEYEVLSWLLDGDYTLNIDNVPYVYNTEDMLTALFDNQQEYQVSRYTNSSYLIQVINENQDMFVTFRVEDLNQTGASFDIAIVEVFYDGYLYEEVDASNALAQIVYEELFNSEDGTLTKKQQITKEEKNPSENEQKQSKKEEPKKEEKKQEVPKTCKWCYTNQLPSEAGDEDKCKECQEENWNFYCGDCGKSMSLNEYWSYGHDTGFCPPCYDKYIQATTPTEDTSDDHKHYYCDRCGVDVTFKNFLQNIEGFDYLCEGCLLELGY